VRQPIAGWAQVVFSEAGIHEIHVHTEEMVRAVESAPEYHRSYYIFKTEDVYRKGMSKQERYEQCERLFQKYYEEAKSLEAELKGAR
jgi:hypothetical protein